MPPIKGPRAPQAPQGEPCGCSGRCGSHWSDTQIVAQVVQGGQKVGAFGQNPGPFDLVKIATMTAIALTESGGYTQACNHNLNGSYDRGLFQINDVWGSLSNYSTDAGNAWTVWQRAGRSFSPWAGDLARRTVLYPRAAAAVRAYFKSIGRNFPVIGDPFAGNPLGPGLPGGGVPGDKGLVPCIHRTSFPGVAGVGAFDICWDTLFGGAKILAGGAVMAIAGLAILYLTARELGQATGTTGGLRLAKSAVEATPAGRVYRTAKSVKPPSEGARTRRTVARAKARGQAAVAREKRRTVATRERASVKRERYRERAADSRATVEIAKTERSVRADEGGYRMVGGKRVYRRD